MLCLYVLSVRLRIVRLPSIYSKGGSYSEGGVQAACCASRAITVSECLKLNSMYDTVISCVSGNRSKMMDVWMFGCCYEQSNRGCGGWRQHILGAATVTICLATWVTGIASFYQKSTCLHKLPQIVDFYENYLLWDSRRVWRKILFLEQRAKQQASA